METRGGQMFSEEPLFGEENNVERPWTCSRNNRPWHSVPGCN